MERTYKKLKKTFIKYKVIKNIEWLNKNINLR
jgi:hypothetical protein